MAKTTKSPESIKSDLTNVIRELQKLNDLIKDFMITELGMNRISGPYIRKIVGGDYNRIARILKYIKLAKKKKEKLK